MMKQMNMQNEYKKINKDTETKQEILTLQQVRTCPLFIASTINVINASAEILFSSKSFIKVFDGEVKRTFRHIFLLIGPETTSSTASMKEDR